MRATRLVCAVGLLLTGLCWSAQAQPATQVVTFQVLPINVISFTGVPVVLTITTAVAGLNPTTRTVSTARWNVTTNQTGAKITASIPTNVPAGVTLSVNLAAPTGATSLGYKALSTVSTDLVTGITKRNQTNRTVNYRLAATAAAGVVPSQTRVITYTITGGS